MSVSVRVARSMGVGGLVFRMVCPVCPPVGRATWEAPLSEKDLAEIWNHTAWHLADQPNELAARRTGNTGLDATTRSRL
jgi:hypothetical protein